MKMHILAVLILSACVAQGQLPLDLDPFLVLELVRTNLNPNSFEVTLDVRAAGNRTYNVQVREGSNWLVVGGIWFQPVRSLQLLIRSDPFRQTAGLIEPSRRPPIVLFL